MYGFIAQLVEDPTGIVDVTGSNPVEPLFFSGFFFPIAKIGKFTVMIILHFDLQPQFKYMSYFMYTSHRDKNCHDKICPWILPRTIAILSAGVDQPLATF